MAPLHSPATQLLQTWNVSPPPFAGGDTTTTVLPSTFFDLIFMHFHPVQRVFFYDFPHSSHHFISSELPSLKYSLSITLSRFYPLAGRLLMHASGKPELVFTAGDSVSVTIAVSSDDFDELSSDHAREMSRFHPLLSKLIEKEVLAIQVTIFPNSGISIGTTMHHGVGDGATYSHFMKTWSAVHRFGDLAGFSMVLPPFFDRSKMRDDRGLERLFMDELEEFKGGDGLEKWDLHGCNDVVLATFVFGRERLEKMKKKTLARIEPALPTNYFGNCLGICCVEAKRTEVVEEKRLVAAEAIWEVIKGLEEGVMERADKWVRNVYKYASERAMTVAGSPKLGVYEVEFGWGKAKKVEIVSIERTGAVSLTESRDGEGGIEAGLALPRSEMEEFVTCFFNGFMDEIGGS
ncbi:malonyl-coenzyme A:anthocyanin 3-O-glucoside-6''-O-malonyltransferase-like [Dioscorea cayenensis subsp. rotundata]|uniref:Malonyl-coenzyme A:anthocyanin 3-O-glucoside-6''-O-malonyltransferase-like n=1 Tax=Dioscorea cayennensis subsp. rotundata TaxID=55577 RepID=A0AB40C3M0_DIOCR|nr:malonyl-coenzyme A:anthocyanin 3-O-glucoside-6''-O-malonyltransferase-like [Dioscorea cayenensis subsp. rotundata]